MRSGAAQLPIELRRRIKSVVMAGLQGRSYIAQTEYAHLQQPTHSNNNNNNRLSVPTAVAMLLTPTNNVTMHQKNVIGTTNI